MFGLGKKDDHKQTRSSPAPKTHKREGISDPEIEEIMTSNLATALKMKIIRLVAGVV